MFKRFPFIHNHGDFVHLDALREWLRGVVSLESFLGSKNDKAIVKDLHFTDEQTSVDYIDTNDDKDKTQTLCTYLTSDVFDENNSNQFNKIDKIKIRKDEHGENLVDVKEKSNQKERKGVIRSDVPVVYNTQHALNNDFYQNENTSYHIGVNNHGVSIYNDTNLQKSNEFWFENVPILYDVTDEPFYTQSKKSYYLGVNENGIKIFDKTATNVIKNYNYKDTFSVDSVETTDINPYNNCYDELTGSTVNVTLHQPSYVTSVNGLAIDGQFMYELATPVKIPAGKCGNLLFLIKPSGLGKHKYSKNFFAKTVEVLQHDGQSNLGVITTLSHDKNYPIGNDNVKVCVFNTSDSEKTFDTFLFTF